MLRTDFGAASGKLLVGNFGNGRINMFDLDTGRSRGPLRKADGSISGDQMASGRCSLSMKISTRPPGIDDEAHGMFSEINADNP